MAHACQAWKEITAFQAEVQGVGGGGKGQMVLVFLENYEGDHDLNEKVMKGELEENY